MLRQGGWAVPLSCEHPLVRVWLGHVGALQQGWCWLCGLEGCQDMTELESCTTFWTPLTLVSTISLVSVIWLGMCAWLIRKAIRRWYTGTLHTEVAKQAAHSARALQQKQSKELDMPGVPHTWCKLARTNQHPVLCAVCFTEVAPDVGVKVNCCEICGIAVHKICRTLMPSNCKPIALKGDKMLHHWLPASCVVESEYSSMDTAVTGQTSLCLYCREPCVGMLLPVEEPIWQCTWCQQVCHVNCHNRHHAVLKAPKGKGKKKKGKQMGQHARSCNNLADHAQPAPLAVRAQPGHRTSIESGRPPRAGGPQDVGSAVFVGGSQSTGLSTVTEEARSRSLISSSSFSSARPKKKRGTLTNRNSASGEDQDTRLKQRRGTQDGYLEAKGSKVSTDDALLGRHSQGWENVDARPMRSPPRMPRRDTAGAAPPLSNSVHSKGLQQPMEICRLGPMNRMVVAPIHVRGMEEDREAEPGSAQQDSESLPSSPKPTPQNPDIASLVEESPSSWTSRAMEAGKKASAQARQQANGLLVRLNRMNNAVHRVPRLGAQQFTYSIVGLTPWHRPLLIFINTKSGPQVGSGLRRWFLRIFNPLQVVELPRQDPLKALRLFSNVNNLRVLVVGGDGTVGWILGCIDQLLLEKEEEAHRAAEQENEDILTTNVASPWSPPPVGVLPLGTGNDLARCLNWGGGMHAVRERGMTALMADIQQAAVVLLDRWNVKITPLRQNGREPIEIQDKAMNNYVGIGVDAKAALDFHNTREHYPQWFQSQLGNKMWYGVVGATDLIGHSCAKLPVVTSLEVDGLLVPLPDDIEGLMLLNITSYMGGVNLWTCGRTYEEWNDDRNPYSSSHLAGSRPQSMSDGIIEVVAVYGTWHLGQLQVGLSKAQRIAQGQHIRLTMDGTLPMQIDGEPWMQGPARMDIERKGQAFMLRRLNSSSAGMMASIVGEALDNCEANGILTQRQRQAVIAELAARLGPIL